MFVVMVLSIALVRWWMDGVEQAELKATVIEARKIANAIEIGRRKATGTAIVNGVYTHSYASVPPGSAPSVAAAAFGVALSLPDRSVFETPYLVTADTRRTTVSVEVPFPDLVAHEGASVSNNGGAVVVTVAANTNTFGARSFMLNGAHYDKRFLYSETGRW